MKSKDTCARTYLDISIMAPARSESYLHFLRKRSLFLREVDLLSEASNSPSPPHDPSNPAVNDLDPLIFFFLGLLAVIIL